jgi:hypothetical protein
MPKQNLTTEEDLDLLAELGIDTTTPEPVGRSPREERIIAGFEEIERFVEEQGRLPQHNGDDIFERIYAVRLDQIRASEECRTLLQPLDKHALLNADTVIHKVQEETIDDAELLASLGVSLEADNDLTQLTHVRSRQEIKAAEEIAQRTPCKDFQQFQPIFKQVQRDLKTGDRHTIKYQDDASINQGDLFILEGQTILIAEKGELFTTDYGLFNARLRVIYDNSTENDLLLRSLQRALNKDKTSRRISKHVKEIESLPLFAQIEQSKDETTGYIYVLRSQSEHPYIIENREIIHKIGVTTGDVKKRVANAKKDPTYLLADVEIVTTFKLANINGKKLESLLHKFFDNARLEVELQDRFGSPVKPREWFFVPLNVIEEVIAKIQEGTLDQFRYDPETVSLLRS